MINLTLKLTLMVKLISVFWKGIPVPSYEPFAYSVLHTLYMLFNCDRLYSSDLTLRLLVKH